MFSFPWDGHGIDLDTGPPFFFCGRQGKQYEVFDMLGMQHDSIVNI